LAGETERIGIISPRELLPFSNIKSISTFPYAASLLSMDLDLLQDTLADHPQQSALNRQLALSLPSSAPFNDTAIYSSVSTNSSFPNSNRSGVVLCKIEDIFESIADCILDEKKHISIQLKRRGKAKNQTHDADSGVIRDVTDEKVTTVKFPSRSPQEAWKFSR
jgi:meiotic recombination protein SPO11